MTNTAWCTTGGTLVLCWSTWAGTLSLLLPLPSFPQGSLPLPLRLLQGDRPGLSPLSRDLDLLWVLGTKTHLQTSGKSRKCCSKGVSSVGPRLLQRKGGVDAVFPRQVTSSLTAGLRDQCYLLCRSWGSQPSWQTLALVQCPGRALLSLGGIILVWPLTFAGVLQREKPAQAAEGPGPDRMAWAFRLPAPGVSAAILPHRNIV